MQRKNYAEVLTSIAAKMDTYEYVARVNTPWTYLSMQVWMETQAARNQGRFLRGAVVFMPSAIDYAMSVPEHTVAWLEAHNADCFLVLPLSHDSHRRTQLRRVLYVPFFATRRLASGKSLTIVAPRHRDFAFALDLRVANRALQFAVLDEGFGAFPVHAGNITMRYRVEDTLRALVAKIPTETFWLSEKVSDGYVVNASLQALYHKLLVEQQPDIEVYPRGKRVAFLCTSYLVEFGEASLEETQAATGRIVKALDDAGFDIWFKQHPRELGNKYEHLAEVQNARALRFLPTQFAGEAYLPQLKIGRDLVIGLLSNLLYTAQVLFDLEVMYLPGDAFGTRIYAGDEVTYAPLFPKGLRAYQGVFPSFEGTL